MVLASDGDRERAAASLRDHFVRGRLTLEELSARLDRVFSARTLDELRTTLDGLPGLSRDLARSIGRGAALVVLSFAWLLFSFVLLVVFGLVALIHGASTVELAGFLVVWLVPTLLLSRLWRRGLARSRSHGPSG
jgi:Flp pilus assembly protein TadB